MAETDNIAKLRSHGFLSRIQRTKKYGNTWTITSWIHQLSTSQPVTRKKGPRAHSGSIHDLTCFYIILYNHILEKSQIAKLPALSRTSNTTRTWWSPQSQRQSVVFLTVQWSSNGHPMVIQWSCGSNWTWSPTGHCTYCWGRAHRPGRFSRISALSACAFDVKRMYPHACQLVAL